MWWAVLGSNQRPKDYACHFGFRRPFPVRGLDSVLPFGLPVESLHVLLAEFRSALAWRLSALAFTEFEKFYTGAESTYPGQPIGRSRATRGRCLGCFRQVLCSNQLS